MNPCLKSFEETVNGEKVTVWQLETTGQKSTIELNPIFDNQITECNWLDEEKEFIEIQYSEWDSSDHLAIMDKHGQLVRKGIRSIQEHIKEHHLFIIEISGLGLGDEAAYYGLDDDDWKMAVINASGSFVIPPEYNHIWFEPDETLFYAKTGSEERKFTLDGKPA